MIGEQQAARLVHEAHARHHVVSPQQQGLRARGGFGGLGQVVEENAVVVVAGERAGVRAVPVHALVQRVEHRDARRSEGGGGGDDSDDDQLFPRDDALKIFSILEQMFPRMTVY